MAGPKEMDAQEELIRLMVLQIRRTAKTQAEVILELDKAGFGQTRIGELLGTSANTVSVALAKAKKRAKASRKTQSGDES